MRVAVVYHIGQRLHYSADSCLTLVRKGIYPVQQVTTGQSFHDQREAVRTIIGLDNVHQVGVIQLNGLACYLLYLIVLLVQPFYALRWQLALA